MAFDIFLLLNTDAAQVQTQQSRMKSENRQAHTLFGVVSLFLIGHLFRMILNLHEVFMTDSLELPPNKSNGSCTIESEIDFSKMHLQSYMLYMTL